LAKAGGLRSLGRYFSATMFFGLAAFTMFSGTRGSK
jgi:hypothetical protein